jgi:hypothetical protein
MTRSRLGNSQRADHLVEALWRKALDAGAVAGDRDDPEVADAFVAWLRSGASSGGRRGVNRYLHAAYETRPDLQAAYPDLNGPAGTALIRWAWEQGRRELIGELLPPHPGSGLFDTGLGVEVVGFLGEAFGLGEAARLYVGALEAARLPVSTRALRPDQDVALRRSGSRDPDDRRAEMEPAFELLCMNPDSISTLVAAGALQLPSGRTVVGQWAWETDVMPPGWAGAFDLVDEIWVHSRFVAENLGRLAPVPVVVVPLPILVPKPAPAARAEDKPFTFLFMLDLFSTPARKNPHGLITAFRRAFGPYDGVRLVIKTLNAALRPDAADALRRAAEDRPDIEFIDAYLDPAEKAALLAGVDCYVSLHRSEGFGLTIAEAMALGTPVIATGYSGNLDFTTPHNSWLVDWTRTNVGPGSEVYPPEGHWAEPDLDHAVAQLRRVRENPEEAASRARRARADVQRDFSPLAVGEIARARLELLADWRGAPPPAPRSDRIRETARRLRAAARR